MSTIPKLFIGSSDEAQAAGLLHALTTKLESELNSHRLRIELVQWPSSPWGNLQQAVQSLVDNLVDYSYAVFILSADDEVVIRGTKQHAARDNVIFEFGLFLAHLGLKRTFLIGPSDFDRTIAMENVKCATAHTRPPPELPLRIASDLGSAYRKGSYKVTNPGLSPSITFEVSEVVSDIETNESKLAPSSSLNVTQALDEQLLAAKAEIARNKRAEAYYSGQFCFRFRDIARLKAHAKSKSVQDIVRDVLLAMERVDDFCDVEQLAIEQRHDNGIRRVWVFADNPLEFRAGARPGDAIQSLRQTIVENLKHGVEYVYFVGPSFHIKDIEYLVPSSDTDRSEMLKKIHIIKVQSQFFSTFFTLHFDSNAMEPKAIYMSSVMRDQKDILIQVSDVEHMKRIYERICVLGGYPDNDSPRVTRYVLP